MVVNTKRKLPAVRVAATLRPSKTFDGPMTVDQGVLP
jgi:hypothetical protein